MAGLDMKRIASLSLDLDNKWSYMKTHGDANWETYPSYLDIVVPRVLKFLSKRNLKITFFIVGQDAAMEKNREALEQIANAGHEIGSHSFRHEPWLHLYSKEELTDELAKTEEALEQVTGSRPVGFRGPGFSFSPTVLDVLCERGYEYDCSTLPTYIAPLARAYYFLNSPKMSAREREKRQKLFGNFSDGFRPLKSYNIGTDERPLVEIPVTTFPLVKTPIHVSYLIYLSTFSRAASEIYWKASLNACRLAGIEPSLLLHPLDFLGSDDAPELRFFPGMNMPTERKLENVNRLLEIYSRHFEIVTMREHAASYYKAVKTSKGERIGVN